MYSLNTIETYEAQRFVCFYCYWSVEACAPHASTSQKQDFWVVNDRSYLLLQQWDANVEPLVLNREVLPEYEAENWRKYFFHLPKEDSFKFESVFYFNNHRRSYRSDFFCVIVIWVLLWWAWWNNGIWHVSVKYSRALPRLPSSVVETRHQQPRHTR